MLLWRPILTEFESGNVLFEEMEKPEYQEKTPRINRRACTKTQLPLAAYDCFYHCASPARQSRGLGGFSLSPLFPDRQIACSRLKDSAVESDGKNARRLERYGLQIARVLFFLGFNYRDVPSIWKVGQANRQKDRQTDILFQYGVSSTFFLGLTKRRVSATPSDVNPDTEVLQINVNLFAFLCFRRNCPICRHPLFSQDSQ